MSQDGQFSVGLDGLDKLLGEAMESKAWGIKLIIGQDDAHIFFFDGQAVKARRIISSKNAKNLIHQAEAISDNIRKENPKLTPNALFDVRRKLDNGREVVAHFCSTTNGSGEYTTYISYRND